MKQKIFNAELGALGILTAFGAGIAWTIRPSATMETVALMMFFVAGFAFGWFRRGMLEEEIDEANES